MLFGKPDSFWAAAVFCVLSAVVPYSSTALAYDDFRAQVLCVYDSRGEFACGEVMARGERARMDVMLNKVGEFSLLVDAEARTMRVLSHKLKAYVEIPVSGDADSWQDLLKSAATAVMPQSLGLVSLYEVESQELGKTRWQGVSVTRSKHVFEASFMGNTRRFSIETWDSARYSPFPMKAILFGRGGDAEASARFSDIRNSAPKKEVFSIPEGYVRYASIMDLLLYALTAL